MFGAYASIKSYCDARASRWMFIMLISLLIQLKRHIYYTPPRPPWWWETTTILLLLVGNDVAETLECIPKYSVPTILQKHKNLQILADLKTWCGGLKHVSSRWILDGKDDQRPMLLFSYLQKKSVQCAQSYDRGHTHTMFKFVLAKLGM